MSGDLNMYASGSGDGQKSGWRKRTIMEMAREAWAEAGEGWVADAWFDDRAKAFEAFAKLVRADEREGTSMTKYEEQIRGMAQQNRGSVGMQEARPQPEQEPVAYDKTEMNCFVQDLYYKKMKEGKHGHYETMFHVVHQAIKKALRERNT